MDYRRWLFYLREYVFPFGCSICGTGLLNSEEAWYGMCGHCRKVLDAEFDEGQAGNTCGRNCARCGKPLVSEHGLCLPCRNREDFILEKIIVLFPYMGKYRKLLAAYKFNKNLAPAHYFAEKIFNTLGAFAIAGTFAPDGAAIVPVPPRPGKIRKTGWDQV